MEKTTCIQKEMNQEVKKENGRVLFKLTLPIEVVSVLIAQCLNFVF